MNLQPSGAAGLGLLSGQGAFDVTTPLMMAIHWSNGDNVVEIDTPRQQVTFGPVTHHVGAHNDSYDYFETVNTNRLIFYNLPRSSPNTWTNTVVTDWRIYDSSSTPQMIWWGRPERQRTVPDGDSYMIEAGAIRLVLGRLPEGD